MSGACARICDGSTPARLAMNSITGGVAITFPSSVARFVIASMSVLPWRRSTAVLSGVSTSTSDVAEAISTSRGSSDGGSRPTWYDAVSAA